MVNLSKKASPGLMFLAGAPDARTLEWSYESLVVGLTLSTKRYLGVENGLSVEQSTQTRASWRAVPLEDERFYQSQLIRKHQSGVGEPSAAQDNDFLEHSFAVHTCMQTPQTAPRPSVDIEESTFVIDDSVLSTYLEDSTALPVDGSLLETALMPMPDVEQVHGHFAGSVTNIRALPNAAQLTKLQPQTMTVNLIAGVISVSPTRTVKLRRGNYDMDIIELTLGDDTKAGFTMSSWHDPDMSQQELDALRQTLRTLRPQDIVLVERVALSSFRGQVFGQSMNRRTSKNFTNLTVLCKSASLAEGLRNQGPSLSFHAAAKLQKVKDWVTSFIGPAKRGWVGPAIDSVERNVWKRRTIARDDVEFLPPDTQD